MQGEPLLHILIGLSWIPMALFQQVSSDGELSHDAGSQQPIFNASLAPQLSHRFMGNLWTGFATSLPLPASSSAADARRGNRKQMAFWDWTARWG